MRKRDDTRIFLNPHCSYDTGLSRWGKVQEELHRRLKDFETDEIQSLDRFNSQVTTAVEDGAETLVAAGGDGTVNLLLNAVMTSRIDRSRITLGAIGLGSSNDFHKPFRPEAFVKGIPVRVNSKNALSCDVIRIDYEDVHGCWKTRFCLNNASIGITAEANGYFNSHAPFLRALRRVSVEAAVVTSALKTISNYRGISCRLSVGDRTPERITVTNLGVVKNPHFAGSFCYDSPITPDDGMLGIHVCQNFSFMDTIKMLFNLSRRRFLGFQKTRSWVDTKVSVAADGTFALEMDGEVVRAASATFRILPQAVRCCR